MGTVANIKIQPMSVTWGVDTAMVQTITCVADASDSLDGKYFLIYTATNAIKYHVWFNTSGGSAVDPNPGGSTAVVVNLTTGANAATVATAVAAAIDALAGFVSTATGAVVTVTNASSGYASLSHEGVGSGFTFALTTEGDLAADVGYVDGAIEFSLKEDLVEVKAHQTGSNTLSQIRTGKKVELKLTFKETSAAQLRKVLRAGGGSFTPAGASGTEVVGHGTYADFTQTLLQASKLVLHPVVNSASDHSGDYTFHLAYPMFENLSFSGEKELMVPVSFIVYPKTSLNSRVQYYAFGDGTQTLT